MTLECVVNLSEGSDLARLETITASAGRALLDLHSDAFHNRSVCTLAADELDELLDATYRLARSTVELLDLTEHRGVHPRLGLVDVVPFVPVGAPPFDLTEALEARRRFALYASEALGLSCFLYGPERTLPEIRRTAFVSLSPDLGPAAPDPTRGACCVGARTPLVAYNVVLEAPELDLARQIANELRSPAVRALGFAIGDEVQVSCNLIEPYEFGPAELVDACRSRAAVARTELVGLLPAAVLAATPQSRWPELDLGEDKTIEARLSARRD